MLIRYVLALHFVAIHFRVHGRFLVYISEISYHEHYRNVDSSQSNHISITTADNNQRGHAQRCYCRQSQWFDVNVVLYVCV